MADGIIAVVPARGGSKGIPKKNLCLLGGIPLVAWSIRVGLGTKQIDRVILSTDDRQIAEIGKKEGSEVWLRPPELATDSATTLSVLQNILDRLAREGANCKLLVLLEPTSPFRPPGLVDRCITMSLGTQEVTVVTVTALERNPFNIFSIEGNKAKPFVQEPQLRFSRRQDFSYLKRLNGSVYVLRPDNLRMGYLFRDAIDVIEMSPEMSINIDTPLDFQLAKLALEKFTEEDEMGFWILRDKNK